MPQPANNRQRKVGNKGLNGSMKNKNEKKLDTIRIKTDYGSPVKEETVIFYFSPSIAFQVILCLRIISAIWLHITDCDETFNYWEPSHYLLFKSGFQPWEYSPQFALRSYFYLLIHTFPVSLYQQLFHSSRLFLFYLIRCALCLICALCEVLFYKAVCREFGINIGRIMLVILIFSPGMYIASTAFLPSTTSMYMTFLSMTAWFHRKYSIAIFFVAFSSLVSWPFSALIGLPIAIEMVFLRRRFREFLKWSILSAFIILTPQILIDSTYYGKLTIAPWNIVKYNVFSSHGPNLYGTDPWYFYVLNGILNFNVSFCLALLTPVLLIWIKLAIPKKPRNPDCLPYIMSLGSLYLWLGVFFAQPHKEERFLFPVYPLIALCSAVGIDALQVLWFRYFIRKGFHYTRCTLKIAVFLLFCFVTLGVSRILVLYKSYYAPMAVYTHLKNVPINATNNVEVNLCVGKDWYQFPGSFFLPDKWKLNFVDDDIKVQLPAHYLSGPDATSVVRTDMNDINRKEKSRFINIDKCDYLANLGEPRTIDSKDFNWTSIYSVPYLDVKKTPFYARSFYVPVIWEAKSNFHLYHLFKRNRLEVVHRNNTNHP